MSDYKLKLNLEKLQITKQAHITWTHPEAAAAHEGYASQADGSRLPGFQWIDQTLNRVNVNELYREKIHHGAESLNEALQWTAEGLGYEFQQTLQQAPESGAPFDYQAIAQSQEITFEE